MPRRMKLFAGSVIAAALLLSCGPIAGRCGELPLESSLEARLADWPLDFAPVRPCGSGQMRVTSIVLDHPAGAPRVSFMVGVDEPVFLLGQSHAVRAFTQVPDGATRLAWDESGTSVVGFESPPGARPALLYLRWEVAGLIHEFQANPSRRFTASVLREIGRLNILRTLEPVETPQ